MGMAASQARYLALVARKSNCEYEGQQINQARTVLSNQSANLFNQMLGLNVPVPPSTQDFTTTQYSYTDGINASTISSWQQLSEADPEYNYVVTHYYYTDRYTGSMKKLSDPQVQFSAGTIDADGQAIKAALDEMAAKYAVYEQALEARKSLEAEAANLKSYANIDSYTRIKNTAYNSANDSYTFNYGVDGTDSATFVGYDTLYEETIDPVTGVATYTKSATQNQIDEAINALVAKGALSPDYLQDKNKSGIYFYNGQIAFSNDLRNLYGTSMGGTSTTLPIYSLADVNTKIGEYDSAIAAQKAVENEALADYNAAVSEYESLSYPTYIGNCELTPLATLTEDQAAEINQVISDLREQEIDANILNCFDANGQYTGGIYQFKLNGVTYYTTFEDLENSYASGTGNNHIDGQVKMAYYNASYVSTKVEETEKALLETDGNGRFTSVRFENDSITYTLNIETITDEAAYQDAMNQYNYENALYDKMVQEINAKTSIIHQEDQQLELRLKQLDTEQNALATEIDAVSKVVKDNIESSFKTFGG